MSYSTGTVYKIICKLDSDIVYIGSTFNSLRNRWQHHKALYKSYLEGKEKIAITIFPYFEKIGIENFKIIQINEYECYRENRSDRRHLNVYEQLWINKTRCVNKVNPFNLLKYNTNVIREYQKEYREKNKDKIREYHENNKEQRKEYYEKNKEQRKEYYEKNKEQRKEYNEKNKENYKEYQKEYRKKNKDKIREKNKEKVECIICKSSCGKYSFKAHERTPKHIKNAKQVIYNFIISKF